MMTNEILAFLHDDVVNAQDYTTMGEKCYHRASYIGKMTFKMTDEVLTVSYRPWVDSGNIEMHFSLLKWVL